MIINDTYHFYKRYWQDLLSFKVFKKIGIYTWYKKKLLSDKPLSIVIEFPKCGRTWLRFMIHQAEALKYNVPLINTMHEVWYREYGLPRVGYIHGFKPEYSMQDYHHEVQTGTTRRDGYIFIVRDPKRVMISYYHQCCYREGFYKGSFANFLRDKDYGISKFIEYIDYYYPRIKQVKHFILRYEDLSMNPELYLKGVLEFVDLSLSEQQIKQIVKNSNFSNMKQIEKTNRFRVGWLAPSTKVDSNSYKVRTGGKDHLEDYYTQDDLIYLHEIVRKSGSLRKLGYE